MTGTVGREHGWKWWKTCALRRQDTVIYNHFWHVRPATNDVLYSVRYPSLLWLLMHESSYPQSSLHHDTDATSTLLCHAHHYLICCWPWSAASLEKRGPCSNSRCLCSVWYPDLVGYVFDLWIPPKKPDQSSLCQDINTESFGPWGFLWDNSVRF